MLALMWGKWKEENQNSYLQVRERPALGLPWMWWWRWRQRRWGAGSTGLIRRSSPKALQPPPVVTWLWRLPGAQPSLQEGGGLPRPNLGPPYLPSSPSQTRGPHPCPILQMGKLRLRAGDTQGQRGRELKLRGPVGLGSWPPLVLGTPHLTSSVKGLDAWTNLGAHPTQPDRRRLGQIYPALIFDKNQLPDAHCPLFLKSSGGWQE